MLYFYNPLDWPIDPDAEETICVSDDPNDPVYKCSHCGLEYHTENLYLLGRKPHTFKCDMCENDITLQPISTS